MNYVGTDGGSVFESRQKGLDERVSATVGSARSCPGKLAWNLQVPSIISSIGDRKSGSVLSIDWSEAVRLIERACPARFGSSTKALFIMS